MSDIFEFPDGKGPNFPSDLADERAERERKEAEERAAKAEAQSIFEGRAQAIYDALKDTSDQYGFIWSGRMPKAWKMRCKALFGTPIAEHDIVRRAELQKGEKDRTYIRINKQQALMAKLAKSDDETFVIADPKGAAWIALLIHRSALGIPYFRITGQPLIRGWHFFGGMAIDGKVDLHPDLISSKWTDQL